MTLTIGTDSVAARLGQVIQSMVQPVGFDVELAPTEFVTALNRADAGRYEAFAVGWSGRVDPDGNVYGFVHSKGTLNNAGFVSPQSLKRFEYETRVLGRLKHPGVAQIYDAGTADAGRGPQPFFAMELVEGAPLDEYVVKHERSVRQRLKLLIKLCDAVQYAHQQGVVHRDLKPGNILVTDDGQPNTEDQGVAEIIVGKQRNGPTGTAKLAFIKEFTRFENLAHGAA